MIFKDKKGMTWQQIVLAIIAVIVVVVVVMFFRSSSEKGFNFASDKIDNLVDCDDDGISNLYDKCPNNPGVLDVWPEGMTECPKSADKECVNKK
jgi:hypothetical protein